MAYEDGPIEETWQEEGFESYGDYEKYYCRLVDDLLDQSRRFWQPKKDRWKSADRLLELDNSTGFQNDAMRSDVPVLPQAVEEAISLLTESLPRPQTAARQAAQDDMASALNYFISEELDANEFDVLMARVALDMKKFNIGCIKQSIDRNGHGPFGNDGNIRLTKVDPRHIWPDPFAKSWRWGDYLFLVVAEPDDLANIRERFPMTGKNVRPESQYSIGTDSDDKEYGESWVPNENDGATGILGERHRALVKECWLNDKRMVWECKYDPDGNKVYDEQGEEVGKWVRRYPNGRCLITANGKLLLDVANPFRHKQPPYTFFPGRISSALFSYGDVEVLGRIQEKINTLAKDAFKNLRANINSPWIVDAHAFDSPQKFQNITNEEGLVIIKRPGAQVERATARDLPPSLNVFMGWLKSIFDDILGVQSIMRGQIAEGAQLSAEAVQNLQGASTSRIRLKSRLLETSLEHLGYLLQWNIRQLYPTKMEVELQDTSSGELKKIYWNDNAAQGDYAIEIQTGSSLPGAKQGAAAQAILLWSEDLIDREAALAQMQYPGFASIIKRMNDREEKLAVLGLEHDMHKNKTGRSGRRSKSIQI